MYIFLIFCKKKKKSDRMRGHSRVLKQSRHYFDLHFRTPNWWQGRGTRQDVLQSSGSPHHTQRTKSGQQTQWSRISHMGTKSWFFLKSYLWFSSNSESCSVVFSFLWPHGLQTTRLLCPWNSPGKNTGMGCHALLQGSSFSRDQTLHCRQILYHLSY